LGTYQLEMAFDVTNHGPGAAALLPPDAAAELSVGVTGDKLRPWCGPFVLGADASVRLVVKAKIEGRELDIEQPENQSRLERCVELMFRTESTFDKTAHDEHNFSIILRVQPQDGQFVPQRSIAYEHSGELLLTKRRYPRELV
jgi:hypothetical protein